MKNEESCYYGRECFDDCRLFIPQDTFVVVVEVSETMYLEDVLYVSFKHLKLMLDILKERNQACRSLGIYVAGDRNFELRGDKIIFFESLDGFDRPAVSFCKLFNSVIGEAAADKHPVKYVLITLEDIYVKRGREGKFMKASESVGKAGIRMGVCNYAWFEMCMAEKPSFDVVFLKLFIMHNLVVYRIKGMPVYSMEIVSSRNVRDRIIGASVRGELDDHSIIELLKERFDTYIASQFNLGQKRLKNLLLVLRVSSHGVLDDGYMKGE